jgi:S1-C subfamily serine protease
MIRRQVLLASLGLLAAWSVRAGLPEVIDAARPAVVAVGTYDALRNPRFTFRGTGFAVGRGDRIITNAHVLPKAGDPDADARLAVLLPRVGAPAGAAPDVRLIGRHKLDPDHDLAALDVEGAPLPPLPLAEGSIARAGTSVVLIGYPLGTTLGLVPAAHRGIVAAVTAIALPPPTAGQLDSHTLSRLRQGAFEILQLDATAYPGNSGSPLLDADTGRVVGVINMVYVKSTKESAVGQPTGITYAIPVRHVQELLDLH